MSKQISSLLNESNNSWKQQRNETKALVSKWNKTGLLEGIDKEYDKHNTAILLENQAKQLISEASATGTTTTSEDWNGVALPLVRRIFGEIASKDFVSVQPMNLPSGLVFWLDFKYGTTQTLNGITAGDDIMGNTSSSSKPTGGLYGKGNTAYSTNVTNSTNNTFVASTAVWSDLGFDGALSASVASGKVFKLAMATEPGKFDTAAVQSVTVVSLSVVHSNLNAYNYYEGGTTYMFVSASSFAAASQNATVHYTLQPANSYTRGDFEQDSFTTPGPATADDLQIPEIDVSLRQEALVAKTRKLKVVWTPEFAQDLNAYHSIDAEAELTSMLSEYISMEIDMEILEMVSDAALHSEYWSAEIGKTPNTTTNVLDSHGSAAAFNQGTWFQTLGTKIQKVSNKIHASTMRGGANFLVCSPDVATILESIPGYAADTDGTAASFAMGVQKTGMMNNRWTVYKNPYWQDNIIVMGFRGSQFLETGAVYAPYIPLIMTPLVYDPQNFTPRKGVMTRYAKKVVRPEFYGKVFVGQLNTL